MPVKEGATTSAAIFRSLFRILSRPVASPTSIALNNLMTFLTLIRWKKYTPLTGLTKASGSTSKLGISWATDWPMFVKWLLNASVISLGEVKTWFSLETLWLIYFAEVGVHWLIARLYEDHFCFHQGFQKVFMFSFLYWGIGLISCNCFQIKGSFVDAAFFFRKSLLCISRNSSFLFWIAHAYQ